MLKGIDISHHQKGIDLGLIETDFVICKATEGNGYTDECCDAFYQKAKSLGKKLGVYHFARPDLGNTAEAEADWFIKETKGYHKEAILVLDWEQKALNYPVSWAKAWLDRVYEKTGVKPILYIQASALSKDWSSVVTGDYELWVANYGSNNGTAQESVFNKYPLKHWPFYALWQYTSKGKLNGYSGNLDLNYFSGDASAWDKYAGGSPSTSSTSTNTSTSSNDIPDGFFPSRGYFKRGDSSPNVGKIATFMRNTFPAYTSEKALGNLYGPYIESAIKEFQRRAKADGKYNDNVDGFCGPITVQSLMKYGFKI